MKCKSGKSPASRREGEQRLAEVARPGRRDDERRVQALAAGPRLTFQPGKGGHLIVRLGHRMSVLPMHGKQKDLGTGLVNAIKRDLGLR